MHFIKRLPRNLALIHAVLGLLAFGLAMPPLNGGIVPLIVLAMIDFPVSSLASVVCDMIDAEGTAALMVNVLVYISLGSAWFYLLGLQRLLFKVKSSLAA